MIGPCESSEKELMMLLATEVRGWRNVHIDEFGEVRGSPPHLLSQVPFIFEPYSPDDLLSSSILKERLMDDGKLEEYLQNLRSLAGDANRPTSKQMLEAELMTYRSTSSCCRQA